jgi:CBS domain-containing protein
LLGGNRPTDSAVGGSAQAPSQFGISLAPTLAEEEQAMPIGDVCVRDVVIASKGTTIQEAAQLMRQHHVGNVVIVEENGRRIPVGIVTDRDIVVSVIATTLDPAVFTLGDLVTEPAVTIHEDQGIFETIQQMRINGIRRMPIVDRDGSLVGIVSVDDLVQLLSEEMGELARLISKEQMREVQTKR